MITREEFEAGKTKNGGFTREQLRKWGVPWPPIKGWKKRLVYGHVPGRPMRKPDPPACRDQADRIAMKKLYQEKSGDYSY